MDSLTIQLAIISFTIACTFALIQDFVDMIIDRSKVNPLLTRFIRFCTMVSYLWLYTILHK